MKPNVSFTAEPDLLIESQATASLLSFSLSEPPSRSLTITIATPNLSEFDLSSIQTQGGELDLNDDVQLQLKTALSEKVTAQVPGATIAITSPLGSWSEAAGVANIENNTLLQPSDRFQIGSVTKTFTATTVLKLAEAGKLTLEDTLTDWLPQAVTANIPNADKITVKQLLNHTSGIAEYDAILLQQAVTDPSVFLTEWQPEQIVKLIAGVEPFFAPGESWQYSNTNYILAGMVIEAASDNNVAAEIRAQILDPLNLENTFFAAEEEIPGGYVSGYLDFDFDGTLDDVSLANPSWTWTSGAIVSNTQDLTQFARALYAGELLSSESLAQMFTLVDTGRGYSYGLGMMGFETPDLGTVVGHRGGTLGFNANMWYSSEDDFTYVDLANGRTNEELVADIIPAFTNGVIPTVGNTSAYSEFNFAITEQNAQISMPVANDGEIEGEETATFTLEPSDTYEINPAATVAIFTLTDTLDLRGQVQFDVAAGEVVTLTDFGGVGLGSKPSQATVDELDTLKFFGEGLTAANMQPAQAENDLEITFLGDPTNTKVVLQDVELETLDNLSKQTQGNVNRSNIIFSDETSFADSFDVFNADSTQESLWNRNSVTFLNSLDNTVQGYKNSDDVINGLGGNDMVDGLSGDDLLRGGLGNNLYTGGAGADQFVFATSQGEDTITDFEVGIDQIRLAGVIADAVKLLEQGSDTLVLTNSNKPLGVVQGVAGLDSSVFV